MPAAAARPAAVRLREPWPYRLGQALGSYLPLLLMLMLALGTWWLVENSPRPPGAAAEAPLRNEPDYSMTGFAVERFDASGRLLLRLEGAEMHHYPATDRIEIQEVRIRALGEDGRLTLATARRALANGDGSEVQLIGGAEINSSGGSGAPLVMRSEFLHAFFLTERVTSNRPVVVLQGGSELRAAGLVYDHPSGRLDLSGPTRLVLPARAARGAR
jgi:lipopolysaccharide export system protein LptC